jgi:hypothetical protein
MKFSKFLVGAAIAVTAVSANAYTDQELGQALAVCSGDYAFVGLTQIQANNTQEGQKYMDISVAFFKAASARLGRDITDKLAAQELRVNAQRIKNNDPKAAGDIMNRVSNICPTIAKSANVAQYLK